MSVPPPQYPQYPQYPQEPPTPPYGPGPQWNPMPMAPPALNAFAVTSLVTALLVCLAPLGLVFGLVALWQIPRKGQRGKGLAIAGVSVSGAVLVLAAGLATVGDFRVWTLPARDDKGAVTEPGWAPVQSLDVGDCFTPGAWMREKDAPPLGKGGVQVIPCDETHRAEAYATFRLAEQEEFPGREAIAEVAWERCAELLYDYSVDPDGFGPLQTYYFHPDEVGWNAGRRTALCWVARPGHAELDGSVRRDEADLDTDQLAFLSAAKPMYVVTAQRPAKSPEQDLAGAKAWAERMAAAQAETIQRLEKTELAGAERPTEQLVAELKTGLPFWRKASDASDADAFLEALRSLDRHSGAGYVARIRTALGLPASANQR